MNALTKVAATAVVVPMGLLAMTLPSHAETATVTEECVASPPVPGTPAQYLYEKVTPGTPAVMEYDVENKQRTYWQEKAPEGGGWKITDTRVKVPEMSHQEYDVENKQATGWRTTAPEGEGWRITDTRTIIDVEAWDETVVVSEAWTETIEHDAEYKHHEAKYKDVHHEAVYDWVWHEAEYETKVTQKQWKKKSGNHDWRYKWYPANANPQGWTFTGQTKTEQVKVKDAWKEKVLVKEAWTEQVLVKEAWDELVKDAWTEEIHHPEVTKVVHHEAVTHDEHKYSKYEALYGVRYEEIPAGWTIKRERKIIDQHQVLEHKFFKNEELYKVLAEEIPSGWTIKRERVRTPAVAEVRGSSGWVLEAPEGDGWELIDSRDAVDAKDEVVCEPEGETPEVPEEETPVDEEEPATDSPKDEEPVKVDISIPATIHVKISTLTSEKSPESAPVAKKAAVAQATTSTKAAPAKDAALAHTGGPSGLIAGLGLLLAGAGAVIASRRK